MLAKLVTIPTILATRDIGRIINETTESAKVKLVSELVTLVTRVVGFLYKKMAVLQILADHAPRTSPSTLQQEVKKSPR